MRSPLSVLVILAGLLASCGDDGVEIPTEVIAADLPCGATNDRTWESAPWPPAPACDWLFFGGMQSYLVTHPLGRTPAIVLGYIAFVPDGDGATVGSGDAFLVETVSDTVVTVRNGTNQNFFLKLVLR